MSNQRFSVQFREALWHIHDRRCLYCTESLLFMDMEVDHVVPEQLLSDPVGLDALKKEMALDADFKVLGSENLAPSCEDCNRKKHGRPFPAAFGVIILGKIAAKLPALQVALDRKRQERDLDNTLRQIALSLEKGQFTHEDLLKGLDFVRKLPNGISGSKISSPPSPEEREANIRFGKNVRLGWRPEAIATMAELGYSADYINETIYRAVASGSMQAKRLAGFEDPMYEIRVDRDLRIIFATVGDDVVVLSVVRKRSETTGRL